MGSKPDYNKIISICNDLCEEIDKFLSGKSETDTEARIIAAECLTFLLYPPEFYRQNYTSKESESIEYSFLEVLQYVNKMEDFYTNVN